jgi:hypothetical protein
LVGLLEEYIKTRESYSSSPWSTINIKSLKEVILMKNQTTKKQCEDMGQFLLKSDTGVKEKENGLG